jgi:4-hydroxy-3-methylbut-2-enyl diphosphate reductase
MRIEQADGIGFCFGVKRAINILEKIARERGGVETLGATVHNQQVLQRLAEIGVRVAGDVDEIRGDTVVIGSHGISPSIEGDMRARHINIIDTTCPFVRRAQLAARRFTQSGFLVIVYGDVNHPEVKGILGWADGKGLATLDDKIVATFDQLPRRLGILSQTTQILVHFIEFTRNIIGSVFIRDSELRIIDTICHDVRKRQKAALELAEKVDLMLVIGGHTSANTNHLTQLCSTVTKTHLIETAAEIQPSLFEGYHYVGVTSGASTAEQTINEVMAKLAEVGSL